MANTETERTTLQERIHSQMQHEIMDGTLQPGARLRVAHLARRFGTSQAPVREALRRLTEEGLATSVPFQGTILRVPSWDEIQDIYLLREELEAYAVRRILANKNTVLADIRRALRDLRRAVRAGEPLAVLTADLEFHRQICMAAGSPLTLEVWELIMKRFRGARATLERQRRDDLSTIVASHEVLMAALEAGDAAAAEKLFRSHLRAALDLYEDGKD